MSAPALDVKAAWVSRELTHDRQLYRAQFSPDGRFIAAGGQDKFVHLWELEREGNSRKSFDAHRAWVSSLAFHPEEKRLFSADCHGVVHCWDYEADGVAKPRWTISTADNNNVRALAVSPDGRYLVSAGDDGIVKVWNTTDGTPVARLEGHRECVFSLVISPDGQHLASGDLLGCIRHWQLGDGWNPVRELDAGLLHTRKEDFLADVGGVRSLAFSPDGHLLAAGGMKEAGSNTFCPGKPTVLVFDWAAGEVKNELGIKGKSDGPCNALRFLEDGVLAGHTELLHAESELTFWDPSRPEPLHSVTNESAYDLSLHPDGRRLLAVCHLSAGSTGNGAQERFKEKYLPNGTTMRIFSLFPKPEESSNA